MAFGTEYFARRAAEHSATCTPEENRRRKENGQFSNISVEYEPEVAEMLFRGTATTEDESQHQPSGFGGAIFAHA